MDIDQRVVTLLAEIGFIAVNSDYRKDAMAIVNALRKVRPKSAVPIVIEALVKISRKDNIEAIKLLRNEALKLEPDHQVAKITLAEALKNMGHNSEAEELLKQIDEKTCKHSFALAKNLLTELKGQKPE